MFSFFNLFKTLRGRLVLLICLAALPTILFVFYVAQKERSHVLTRMTEDGHHLANLVLREHTHQIETAKNLLLRLGEILKYKGKYSFVLKDPDFLPTILKGHTHLANVGILSKEGEVIRSAYPLSRFPNMKDNPAFRRALLSNKVEIGDYIIGPIVSIPILNLAYAIRDEKDATQMVVFNALDLEWLGSFVKQIHLPQEYLLHIVNPQGQILAQVGETTEIPSSLNPLKIPDFSHLLDQKNGKILQIKKGTSQRFFIASSMNYAPQISIVVSLPYEKMMQSANKTFYRTLGGLSLLTLFTIISVLVAAELSLLRIIRNLSKTARQFGKGNFDIRVPVPKHHGELSELALEFNSMAEALLQRHNELLKAHDRLKTLSRHLQNAREEEARRIARELHDGIGQILTIIKIDLATLQKKCLTCKETSKASAIETEIIKIKESIDEAIKFVRRISSELRPAVLDRLGFPSALEWQTREFEIRTSISTQLEIKNIKESIDEDISTALFRVTQEALTNVIRHANASEVHISLICNENDFSLSIRDNGKGIANSPPYGINTSGIIGMEERVRLLNGQFSILGEHQKGTTIRIQIPKRKPHRSYDAYTTL